jgi:hypothetical protein
MPPLSMLATTYSQYGTDIVYSSKFVRRCPRRVG